MSHLTSKLIDRAAKPQQERWQREFLSHAPEYGAEFVGTVFLVFCVVAAVAVIFAPASPVLQFIPSTRMPLCDWLDAWRSRRLSRDHPLGRISGAHLNPAISLGFFAEGKMQLQDLFGYIIAQLGGGIVGEWAAEVAAGGFWRSVHETLNLPARGVSSWSAAGAELVGTFSLVS